MVPLGETLTFRHYPLPSHKTCPANSPAFNILVQQGTQIATSTVLHNDAIVGLIVHHVYESDHVRMRKLTKRKDLVAESLLIGERDSGFHDLDSTELRKSSIEIRNASAFSDTSRQCF
jgi:hypothetical protein